MSMRSSNASISAIHILALGALWALGLLFGRISLSHGFPVTPFAMCQALGIAAVTICLSSFNEKPRGLNFETLRFWGVSSVFLIVAPYLVTYFALSNIGASRVAIILATTPIFTAILAYIGGIEQITVHQLVGITLGFVGVTTLILLGGGTGTAEVQSLWFWTLVAMLSPLSYALANVLCYRLRPADLTSLQSALGTNILAAAGLTALYLSFGRSEAPTINWGSPDVAVWFMALTVAVNALASVAFFFVLSTRGAISTSVAGYVTALLGSIFGFLLLGEEFNRFNLLSIMLVLGGVFLATPRAVRS
jgi:drug/metabolite transporter (DMT)-like permease